jgi:hypothetical protein
LGATTVTYVSSHIHYMLTEQEFHARRCSASLYARSFL